MNLGEVKHDFKSAVFSEFEKEILSEYGIPYCKWVSMIDIYKKVRSQIGIDETTYYEVLDCMYKTRKALDNMRF